MAERKGPGGEQAGRDRVESGRQDDRSHVEDGNEVPGPADAGEGTDLNDIHGDSDSAESGTTQIKVHDSAAHDSAAEPVGTTDSAEDATAAAPAHDSAESGGKSPEEPTAEVIAFRPREDGEDELVDFDGDGERVDLAELQADDALLDMLGGTNPDVRHGGEEPSLDALLVAWRQDVDSSPIGELVDVDTAVATIAEARKPRRRLKRRHLVPVASAAAVLMITFTGVGLAARDAMPGDALWGVAQVLYTDHARMAQAATSAKDDLNRAEGALDHGDRWRAEAALDRAHEMMQGIDSDHGLADLQAAHASLTARMGQSEQPEQPSSSSVLASSSVAPPPSPTHEVPPPVPPTDTTSTTPSTSPPTSETSSSPSETSGSSDQPSSGTGPSWNSNLFPSN
ncbi:anti-sigma-D factor RsdA [Saccharopolyspora taberi]|uniref:Anti-sigma-D factor RsdA sigma factor binding region domain-containing protein n=1 Tax=Saccharopolyspora taberi TaxID=60895 RepID=A0ABN3VIV4_9PSEU